MSGAVLIVPATPLVPSHFPLRLRALLAVAVVALSAALLGLPGAAKAATGTAGDLTWVTNGTTPETVKITSCAASPCASTIVMPATIDGLAVTSIGERAFSDAGLVSISIPDSVTTIEQYAFLDASSLTAIAIPAGVTTIERQTFWGATSLASITLPEGLTTIRYRAFGNNAVLRSLRIPASVTTLDDEALDLASFLEAVYFLGNKPAAFGASQFAEEPNVTVYHFRGAAGWPAIADLLQMRPQAYTAFPAAPPAPTAVAGTDSAVVTATPAPIGEAPTSYAITATPGGRSCTASASGTCSVSGLTPGTTYTFTAIARNADGDSSVSARSAEVTPAAVAQAAPLATQTPATTTTVLTVSTKATETTITTTFTAPGPGQASQTGTTPTAKDTRGKAIKVCSASKKIKKAGKVRLTCTLTKAARALRKKNSLTVLLTTTFTPTSGTKAISTKTIKLGRK
jgi:hypothetical protein